MKISIAMATCEGAQFVAAQLESFLAQTRQPDEVIVTDDLSSDPTAKIVSEFARSAPFAVRHEINGQRLGVAQNFGRALSLCSGDLVLPSDQDDIWLPEKIAMLEQAALAHPNKACFINDALLVDADLKPTGSTKRGQIRAAGLPDRAMVMGCCSAFRRSLLSWLLPVPANQRAHDNWLVQMADLMDLTLRLDTPLQYYRRHDRNVSNFVVNRLQVPGKARRLGERIGDVFRRLTTAGGLAAEHQFLEAAALRMRKHAREMEGLLGPANTQRVLFGTQSKAVCLGKRRAIRALPRHRRLTHVWDLWRNGAYLSSGKVTGAIKDLFIDDRRQDPAP